MHNKEWLTRVIPSINGNTWDIEINTIDVGFVIQDNDGYFQAFVSDNMPHRKDFVTLNSAAAALIARWFKQLSE